MKFWFYLISFFIVSCRYNNHIDLGHFPNPDQKLFVTLEHSKGQSLLRQKLLNLKLRKILKDTSRLGPNELVENGDEFVFEQVSRKMSPDQISQYNKLRSHCAEIIVSYQERQEVYFVMPGIETNVVIKSLNLIKENNHLFTIFKDGDQTTEGEVIYVLNAGKEEMINNDRHFHWSEWKMEKDLDGVNWVLHANQKMQLRVQGKHLIDQFMIATITAPKSKCTPQKMEAEACEACRYKIEMLTGFSSETPIKKLSDLHLDFLLNGKSLKDYELNFTQQANGEWVLEIDPQKLKPMEETVMIEIKHIHELLDTRHVQGFDYSPACLDTHVAKDINFKEGFPVQLKATLFGRELLIDSVKE